MSTPPPLAELILSELIGDAATRDAVLGDLAEEYHTRSRDAGPSAATRWYWGAALASVPPLAGAALRRAGPGAWLRGMAAVLVGLAALLGLLAAADAGLKHVIEMVGAVPDGGGRMVAAIALGAVAAVAAGWLAGTVARRAPLASAVSLAVTCLVLNLGALVRGTAQGPRWFWVGFGIVTACGAVAGGLLRLRQEARLARG